MEVALGYMLLTLLTWLTLLALSTLFTLFHLLKWPFPYPRFRHFQYPKRKAYNFFVKNLRC